jgi:YggT family protein
MFDYEFFGAGVVGLIIGLIDTLLTFYFWVVIIRVLLSWVNPDPYNPIVRFLYAITDPPLYAIRRLMPGFLWSTGLDFSPLVLILLIQIAKLFLHSFRIPGVMR